MAASDRVDPVSLECRDMRHAWTQAHDVVLTEKHGVVRIFTRTLRCIRCETERADTYEVVKSRVELLQTKYKYVQGYHVQGGMSVSTARSMLWKSLLNGNGEE